MKGLLRRLYTGAPVYSVAGVIQRGLPVLLLPVYASVLSPAAFGQISVLIAATAVLGSLMSLGMEASVVRETVRLSSDSAGRHAFLNSVGWFSLVVPLGAAVLIWAAVTVAGGAGFDSAAVLLGTVSVAVQSMSTVFVGAALRAEERLGAYLALTLTNAVATAGLTLLFLVALEAGPTGWFAAATVGGIISLVVGLVLLGHRWSRSISGHAIKGALLFGIPLLPHTLAHWVLNLSDRVIIGASAGDEAVGVYSIAYQAAAPIMLILIAVHQGLMPMYPRAADDAAIRQRLRRVLTGHVHLGAWLGMTAALLAPAVIVAVFPAAYRAATDYIPWIATGYVLFGLYLIPMDSMTLMLGQTRWLWTATVAAAAINLAINLAFVPTVGPLAAAIATAIGYGTLLAGVIVARRLMAGPRVAYETGAIIGGTAWVGVLAVSALVAFPDVADLGAVLGRGALVALAGAGLLAWHLRGRQHGEDWLGSANQGAQLPSPEDGLSLTANSV